MRLLLFALLCISIPGFGQTTILNFESAGTSTDFEYFGMGTLDGTLAASIPNPDVSGINTSSTVLEFVKEGTAQTWGGAFSNPVPATAVDLTTDNQVCIKVWMDHIGNLALKLENSGTGDNWIITQTNTLTNQWEELCFDVSLPSIEAPFTAAAGHVYPTVVVFMDFGAAGTGSDVTTYMDDFITDAGGGPTPADVSFAVDMNEYSGTFSNVYVNGTFNAWCGACDELTDPDSDGIYTGTVNMLTGSQQFKFTVDTEWEEFSNLNECTFDDGGYVNRILLVTGDATLDPVCFNSCYACGDAVTIAIDMGFPDGLAASPDGVWLAGGGNFDDPGGRFQMDDSDGDGIYSIQFERQRGFWSYYAFANGNCPDYSCKENLDGLPCGDPANFNDRQMGNIMNDTTIATCFATCSDTANCATMPPPMGIADLRDDLGFQITPSVTTDLAWIDMDASWQHVEVTVVDMQGRSLVREFLDSQPRYEIDATGWPAGMYLVRLRTEDSSGTQRLIKY